MNRKRWTLALASLAALAALACFAGWLATREAGSAEAALGGARESPLATHDVAPARVSAPLADPEVAPDVTLAPASATREEAQPSPAIGSRIAGSVVDELGSGVPRAQLFLERVVPRPKLPTAIECGADGSFVSGPLAPGAWQVHVNVEGFAEATEVVEIPPSAAALRLVLRRMARVAGVVLDPYGTALAGAQVKCGRWTATSDERGAFAVGNLAAGSIAFVASHEEFLDSPRVALELAKGEQRDGLVLQLGAAGRVEGVLLDSVGEPEPEQDVHAKPAWGEENPGRAHTCEADAQGHFAFVLAPGRWTLRALPSWRERQSNDEAQSLANVLNRTRVLTVEVREGQTAHVVLGGPSRSALRLHGRVTCAGHPLEGALLSLVRERAPLIGATRMAFSGAGGEYELLLDAPGTYMVFASPGGSVESGTQLLRRVAVHGDLALDLEVPAGRVRGRVETPSGADPARASVVLLSESGPIELQPFSRRERSPDAGGRFAFEPLPPGSYNLRASLGPWVSPVVALRLGRGETRDDLLLRLAPPGALHGRVLFADGRLATEARAGLVDARGSGIVPLGSTDDGSFSWYELAPGTYTVLARHAELAATEPSVAVEEGSTGHCTLVLQPAGRLRIRVLERDGLPVTLEVLDARGAKVFPLLDEAATEEAEHGLEANVQTTPPLVSGDYRVRASTELASAERSARVVAGQTLEVSVSLGR